MNTISDHSASNALSTRGVDRRSFLAGAGAIAAAATATTALPAMAKESAEKDVSASHSGATTNSASGTIITRDTLENGTWSFMVAPDPIPDNQITQTKTHEIVIVGSGAAGLCCAVSAAEQGADVIVFSAGTKPLSRGGSFQAIGSKYQTEHGIEDSPELRRVQTAIDQVAGCRMMDMRKWARWENKSAESMDWMIDKMAAKGIKCSLAMPYSDVDGVLDTPAGEHNFWTDEQPMGVFQGAPLVAQAWADTFTQDYGGEIDFSTVAQYLVRDDDNTGRVSAVIAQDADGNYIKYEATKAVVLATGDFSKDFDMMAHFAPYAWEQFKDVLTPEVDYDAEMVYTGLMPGTGQKMGLWVGAGWQKTFPNPCAINGAVSGPTHCVVDSFWGINLAADGRRFHNENTNFAFGAYTRMNVKGGIAFAIWDSQYAYTQDSWDGLGATIDHVNGDAFLPTTPEQQLASWDSAVEAGRYLKADTLDELLDMLAEQGLDKEEAAKSIERYNTYAEQGLDEEFHVNPELLHPIATGPFYAAVTPSSTFLCVMGGLRCDEYCNVLDNQDEPIEGLYEVGTMIGDFYAGAYNFAFQGQNLGACCTTFPYLLGRDLAAM